MKFTVRRARREDREELAQLRFELWPDGPLEEHCEEIDALFATGMSGTLPAAAFVAVDEDGRLVGFLEAGLRSHSDGCDPARPVGYIEGWYVREPWRLHGVGRELVMAAEEWARGQRCREMASDAELDNVGSQRAHEALGYQETERCVVYRKSLVEE